MLALGTQSPAQAAPAQAAPAQAAPAQAAPAQAAGPPLSIAVLVSSRTDQCFDNGTFAAIKRLATMEADRINSSGDLGGRTLKLEFLDDQRDPKKTVVNMRGALANPATIAVLGLSNSTSGKALFESAGKEIRESGVPYISDLAIDSLFSDFPNVFTTRASQEHENLPVLRRFIKDLGVQRPAFVGLTDTVFSTVLGDGLKGAGDGPALVADHRFKLRDGKVDPAEAAAVVRDLKEKNPDFVFLAIGAARTGAILQQLMAAGVRPPVLMSGRLDLMLAGTPQLAYPSHIYQLVTNTLPDAFRERLRQRISRSDPQAWQFEGRQVLEAPGWKSGDCKPRSSEEKPDILSPANLLAISTGTQYGDMVSLVAEILRKAAIDAKIPNLRRHVVEQLQTAYAEGRDAFRGNFENWSFNPETRGASRPPLIVMLRPGQGAGQAVLQLAPYQYVRLRGGVLRPVQTLYLDIDMIRTFRVDDNEKSYFAEFYLSIHHEAGAALAGLPQATGASIDRIDFANAFLDPKTNDRQISVRALHEGGKSATYPADMKLYRIAGKFMFDPKLANYPFDIQRFSIDLQPKLGDAPFIIQPPPIKYRERKFDADSWDVTGQYVGYDEDFVRLIDAKSHEQTVVPFYKGSFVWIMKRQATDYIQRVVVPLAFILAVAYLSIFIPRAHFEAIITIQVTALLSAVALYLALPKIDADTATFSDRIFLFIYLSVSIMIALSIARINPAVAKSRGGSGALALLHIIGIPVMVAVMATIVASATISDGHSWTAALKGLFGRS
jgi:ABC-type branched-subunit amino acid transport system substrate-binding protein